MTARRARAYARVTATLRDLGPAKLSSAEQAVIREAADALVFCADLVTDQAVKAAVAEVRALGDRLVDSERWTAERAQRLVDDVWACGPPAELSLPAAA